MAENHVIDEFKVDCQENVKFSWQFSFILKFENNSQISVDIPAFYGIIHKMRIVLNLHNGVCYEKGIYNRSEESSA